MTKHILIVDDFKSFTKLVDSVLTHAGFKISIAHNGKEALAQLATKDVDMIISDVNMPEMDGVSLLESVRTTYKNQDVPFMLLTTERDEALIQRANASKLTAWINKPFKVEDFVSTVKSTLYTGGVAA
ncbi:MAG: response regulator [Bacteroidota bacterium]